jgi:quinol monooxygenase YgiN
MSELHVVATIPAKPGSEDTLREALNTLVAATRDEEGCVAYDLFESTAAPGTFVTVERWTDQAALDAHMGTPHIAAAFEVAGPHLAGEVAIHPLSPVTAT